LTQQSDYHTHSHINLTASNKKVESVQSISLKSKQSSSLKHITFTQKFKNYELSEIGTVDLGSPDSRQKANVRTSQNEKLKIKRAVKENLSDDKLLPSLSSNGNNDDIEKLILGNDIQER
jgi:hypothetical protein